MISQAQSTKEVTCPMRHTLTSISNVSEIHHGQGYEGDQYFCDTCRNVFNSHLFPSNHCSTCGFDLCHNCYDAQKLVQLDCMKGHPLLIVQNLQQFSNYVDNNYFCDSCGTNLDSMATPAAHCRTCGFDLCPECLQNAQTKNNSQNSENKLIISRPPVQQEHALKAGNNSHNSQRARQVPCPQGHILSRVNNLSQLYPNISGIYRENLYFCDTCRKNYNCAENNSFHCKTCGFDMCPQCEEKSQKINFTCSAGHLLYVVSALNGFNESTGAYEKNTYGCDSCKVNYDAVFHPSCHCRACGYDLCPTCAGVRMKETQHHDDQQIQAQVQHINQIEQLSCIKQVAPRDGTNDTHCLICYNAQRTHKFVPCNHLIACDKCSQDFLYKGRECPVCRSRIGGRIGGFIGRLTGINPLQS